MLEDDALYENLDPNKVLDAFGKYGKFQMRTYILANSVHLLYAVNMMIMPFITEEPKFSCVHNSSKGFVKLDECNFVQTSTNATYFCDQLPGAVITYDHPGHSIASDYHLICSEKNAAEHASSVFLLGGMLVAPLVMQLSDLYGRRLTYLIPLYASLVANVFCIVAPSYNFFLLFRFIGGIANTSFATIGITLSLESVSTKFRNVLPIAYNTFWILGYLLAGVIKLYISDWRTLYLVATLPALLCLPYFWFIPESLHWLCTMKKHSEVKKYIRRVEKYNSRKIDLMACQALTDFEKTDEVKRTFLDIFKNPTMFINLLINGYIFIVLSFTYWALSLFSTDLAEDKMTGFFLSGLIEIPGAIMTNIMIHFWSRKSVSMTSLAAQALCASLMLASSKSAWHIIFPLVMKCFCVVLWSNHPLHSSESTPTSVRNVFLGFVGFIRDIGGVVAPYLKRLAAIDERAPTMLLALLSISAALFVLLLPETRDKELPEDIPDFDPGPVIRKCFRNKEKSIKPEASPMLKQ